MIAMMMKHTTSKQPNYIYTYTRYGVGAVLVFVGFKLICSKWYHVPPGPEMTKSVGLQWSHQSKTNTKHQQQIHNNVNKQVNKVNTYH